MKMIHFTNESTLPILQSLSVLCCGSQAQCPEFRAPPGQTGSVASRMGTLDTSIVPAICRPFFCLLAAQRSYPGPAANLSTPRP